MSKNSKLYKFEKKEDLIIYTSLLIELIVKHLDRHGEYLAELKKLLEGKELVGYKEYKAIEDKINTPQNYLLNLFGDQANNAASYFRIRSVMKRKAEAFGFEYKEHDKEMKEIMNKLNSRRNYEHHFTDAKIIEWSEYRKNQIKGNKFFKWPSERIDINYHDFLLVEDVKMNYDSAKTFNEYFKKLLQLIKKDYSVMIGQSMRVKREQIESPMPKHNVEISVRGQLRHFGEIK